MSETAPDRDQDILAQLQAEVAQDLADERPPAGGPGYQLVSSLVVLAFGAGFLMPVVMVALIAIVVWWARSHSTLVRVGLAICIGGAVSNIVDRWLYGAVADFFWLHWGDMSFFVFNVADAAISLGVCLLILDILGIGRQRAANPA